MSDIIDTKNVIFCANRFKPSPTVDISDLGELHFQVNIEGVVLSMEDLREFLEDLQDQGIKINTVLVSTDDGDEEVTIVANDKH